MTKSPHDRDVDSETSSLRDLVEGQRKALANQRRGELERLDRLQSQLDEMRTERDEARAEAKAAVRELKQVRSSSTWRVGRAVKVLLSPAIWVRRALKRRKPEANVSEVPAAKPLPPARRKGTPTHVATLRTDEDRAMRGIYESAVSKRRFGDTVGTRVAVAVYTLDFDEGRGDIYVAVGLGRYLEKLGYEVIYLPREEWYEAPVDTDLYLALLPSVDAARLPEDCLKVAWVRNETEIWSESPSINWFDMLLASSQRSLDRLETVYAGPTGLLPIGVDLELFNPGSVPDERNAVVSTVNQWGRERDLYAAIRSKRFGWPLAVFGQTRGLAERLGEYSSGPVSFFSLPTIYRQAAIVLDDFNHTTVGFGNVNSRIFEALASGALPVTNGSLGLAELGLDSVPTYFGGHDFHEQIERLLSDEDLRAQLVQELSEVVRERHSFETRAQQFQDLVAQLSEDETARSLLAFFPDYRSTNPYQSLLYRSIREDVVAMPASDPLDIGGIPRRQGVRGLFHIHWTAPILNPAADEVQALNRLHRFVDQLDLLKSRGFGILWTLHNVMPHECPFPELESVLRQEIADRADLVHVMCAEALDAIEGQYVIPEYKVRIVPHCSYVGVYPDVVDPDTARNRLGLGPKDTVVLFLGGVRIYKGIDLLLDAFEAALERDSSLKLVLVGRRAKFEGLDDLMDRAASNPAVVSNFNAIADDDLQHFLKASDVVVLPSRTGLNSGSMLLALTFARPVIAPKIGCLPDVEAEGIGLTFAAGDAKDLTEKLLRARELGDPTVRKAARAFAEQYTPYDMSRAFDRLVGEVIGEPAR